MSAAPETPPGPKAFLRDRASVLIGAWRLKISRRAHSGGGAADRGLQSRAPGRRSRPGGFGRGVALPAVFGQGGAFPRARPGALFEIGGDGFGGAGPGDLSALRSAMELLRGCLGIFRRHPDRPGPRPAKPGVGFLARATGRRSCPRILNTDGFSRFRPIEVRFGECLRFPESVPRPTPGGSVRRSPIQ